MTPAVTSTSGNVHCELLCILFLQAHLETEEYFNCYCHRLPSQHNYDFLKSKHAAFYGVIKNKMALAIAKSAAMRVTMHEYCDCSGLPSQHETDFCKSKHAAFYRVIKHTAGLAIDKSAAMRVTMHIDKIPAVVMGRPARSSR